MKKQKWWLTILLLIMSVIFTVAVKMVDVGEYNGQKIGFFGLNSAIFGTLGANETWSKVSDVIMILMVLVGLIFAVMGLIQWIKRKSLKKVDWEILALGIIFVSLGVMYAGFEVLKINYAPMTAEIYEGVTCEGIDCEAMPKTSFPSSHILLILTVGLTVASIVMKYVKKLSWQIIDNAILTIMMFVAIMGRVYSGEHWATDILASILFSATLLTLYLNMICKKPKFLN